MDYSKVANGWSSQEELSYWISESDVEGTIPLDLYGSFIRNGPGVNDVYGKKLKHRKCILHNFLLVCFIWFIVLSGDWWQNIKKLCSCLSTFLVCKVFHRKTYRNLQWFIKIRLVSCKWVVGQVSDRINFLILVSRSHNNYWVNPLLEAEFILMSISFNRFYQMLWFSRFSVIKICSPFLGITHLLFT